MADIDFKLYRDSVLQLAQSMVIKFQPIAEVINKELKELRYEVDQNNPKTWKYYLHIAGEYHPSDQMMYIKSIDTLEIIEFTKANLVIHKATRRACVPGTIYYESLIQEYPNQVDLINGILNPADLDKAVNAKNGEIIYYGQSLVESNEDTFITAMQNFVDSYLVKNYNDMYRISDDLYVATILGQLQLALVPAILLYRLNNAKTSFAHSYHIKQYLGSHHYLDEFIPYLTKEQQLWLYRNITYIERNLGKQETWDTLVEQILTKRGIPLTRYELIQNTSAMPDEIYPEVEIQEFDVNSKVVNPSDDRLTVIEVLDKEDPLARDNYVTKNETEREITDQVKSSNFSKLPTKVFNSKVIDFSGSAIRDQFSVLFMHWVHLASANRYRAYIELPNPKTGDYNVISVKDAFIVMLYAYTKLYDLDQAVYIPYFDVLEVQRDPLPNFFELRNIAPKVYVKDSIIEAIQSLNTPLASVYMSTEQFYLDCVQFHKEYIECWELYSFQEHFMSRVYCEQVVKTNYINRRCQLVDTPTRYDDYLRANNLDFFDLSKDDYEAIVNDCFNLATGSNLFVSISVADIQRELLRLMSRLSSYPIQYLRNTEYTDYKTVGLPVLRVGDIAYDQENTMNVMDAYLTPLWYESEQTVDYRLPQVDLAVNDWVEEYDEWTIDTELKIWDTTEDDTSYWMGHNTQVIYGVSIVVEE